MLGVDLYFTVLVDDLFFEELHKRFWVGRRGTVLCDES